MDANIVEFAKLLKNDKKVGGNANFTIGKVISPLPSLEISDGSYIILDRENLMITDYFYRNSNVKKDDLVLMIPSSDEQNYIVVDKVVSI